MAQKFRDTLANLAKNNTLNNVPLNQPYLSILVKYKLGAKVVGKVPNVAGKGKPTNIVELSSRPGIQWGLVSDLPAEVTAEASTETVNAETVTTGEAATTEVTA